MRRNRQINKGTDTASASQSGFTLIVVVWALALISLLCLTFVATSRARLQLASYARNALQVELAANSAAQLTLYRLLSPQSGTEPGLATPIADGTPRFCRLPGGAIVAIALEDEGGKVDLNGAPLALLQVMFEGFGVEKRRASDLAINVVEFRSAESAGSIRLKSAYQSASLTDGPKAGLFQTTFEIDQVLGFDESLVKRLLPFLTTRSEGGGVDPMLAPPALFAALAGASIADVESLAARPHPNNLDRKSPRFPAAFTRASARGILLAHVEAARPGGAVYAHDELWDLRSGTAASIRKEVRRGAVRLLIGDRLGSWSSSGQQLPSC